MINTISNLSSMSNNQAGGSLAFTFISFAIIIIFFYFILIRPQKKKD